jgi:hypothetical protein
MKMKLRFHRLSNRSLIANTKGFPSLSLSCHLFDRIIDPLRAEITALKEELLSSQKTFEIYRERARVSLKKTAADQKQSDERILQLTEKLKTVEMKYKESQAQLKLQEQKRIDAIHKLGEEIEQERKVGVQLRKKLEECVGELNEIEKAHEQLSESLQGNAKTVSSLPLPSPLLVCLCSVDESPCVCCALLSSPLLSSAMLCCRMKRALYHC